MDESIKKFLADRLAAWLKSKIKPEMDEEEIAKWTSEGNDKFSLEQWLPDAARRAKQLSIVSHPSKFSHPGAQTSSVIVAGYPKEEDGYLRSGNVAYEQDVFGNAAAMDVYKFLMIKLNDEQTVLSHLEQDSKVIQQTLQIKSADYAELKQGFLAIKQEGDAVYTDRLIKQVYFPVPKEESGYHLLSILTPSGLMTRLKSDIEKMRFSDATKEAKACRKDKKFHESGYDDIFNLTVMGYGGTKPQNISVLNNQNAGRAYLLPSFPPTLEKREVKLPKSDFFAETLWIGQFEKDFVKLHDDIIIHGDFNKVTRDKRGHEILKSIIDHVLEKALKIRTFEAGWTTNEYYLDLHTAQKIWLDDARAEERESNDTWLEEISNTFSDWIIYAYEATLDKKKITLGDGELGHIEKQVLSNIKQVKEFFR